MNDPTTTCKSTHKPNNKQYGIQGATSASNKIAKEKNSNITQNAVTRMPENDKEIYIDSTKCVNQTIMNFGRVKPTLNCGLTVVSSENPDFNASVPSTTTISDANDANDANDVVVTEEISPVSSVGYQTNRVVLMRDGKWVNG